MTGTPRKRVWLTLLVAGAVVILAACENPPPFGVSEGGNLYSDNSTLSWRSIECSTTDYLHFNHFMFFTMADDIDPTAMNSAEKTPNPCGNPLDHPNDDIYWFATAQASFSVPGALGEWECFSTSGTSGSNQCQRGRIMLLETMRTGSTDATKWNVACHEIAHSIGFEHGFTGLSCMDGGGNGIFDTYMIGRINGQY